MFKRKWNSSFGAIHEWNQSSTKEETGYSAVKQWIGRV